MSNPVEAEWMSAIEQRAPKTLEIDASLVLRLVCGTDQAGQPMFCSISRLKPGIPELSDAVEVARTQRTLDGQWVLLLTLKASRFSDVFIRLCAHIVERVRQSNSEAQGLAALMASVEDWRTLLEPPPIRRLSLEATRGLFGELWLGFSVLTRECSVGQVVDAWHGPFGSDQDFQFPGGPLIEVKTVHSRGRRIRISSEHQLRRLPHERLFLAVVTADDAAEDTPGATTVPSLIERTERLLQDAGVARSELTSRLAELGFDPTDDAYADMHFLPIETLYLEVTDTFPRIEPEMLAAGIDRVSYSLDLAELEAFERDIARIGLSGRKASSP